MLWCIMHEEQTVILQTAITHSLEHQRCLNRLIPEHTCCTVERLTILMESPEEEISMIEACQGKTWQGVLHIRMEIPTVFLFQTCRLGGQGVVIEH